MCLNAYLMNHWSRSSIQASSLSTPSFDPGLARRRSEHGGMPRRDDDEFALAAERDRVAAGLEDYAPEDVPPATDPPPPGVSEAVDLAERGLLGDTSIDTRDG